MPIALPEKLDNLDDLAPNLKPLYVPAEGGQGFVFKDVSGIQNAYVATKEKLQTAQATIAQLTDANKAFEGLNPVEVRDLVAKKADIEAAARNQPAEIQTFKTQLEQTYKGAVTAAKQEAGTYKGLIEGQVRDDAIRGALTAAGVRPERLDQAARLMAEKVSVAWDPATGRPRAAILKADGMPVLNPNTGDDMTPADIATQFRKDIPEFFQPTAGNGGGAGGNNTPAPTDGDPLKWTYEQMRAYAKVHGEEALQRRIIDAAKPAKVA